jgi:hypothetical protein
MHNRRLILIVAIAIGGLLAPVTALAVALRARRAHGAGTTGAARSSRAKAAPRSRAFSGTAAVGALYPSASATAHDCTASVVSSPQGNLLITAAHCVSGTAEGTVFAPGEHGGKAPYGRWTVTAAYLARSWVRNQDADDDVAFLTVAPQTIDGRRTEIQQVTGADRLGGTPRRDRWVTVVGYPGGSTNDPITCRARVYVSDGFPAFDCHGYVGGTSGSPWVLQTARGPEVVGVIGGLEQGGCVEYTSYSPPLSRSRATYRRAVSGGRGDTAPRLRGDGC